MSFRLQLNVLTQYHSVLSWDFKVYWESNFMYLSLLIILQYVDCTLHFGNFSTNFNERILRLLPLARACRLYDYLNRRLLNKWDSPLHIEVSMLDHMTRYFIWLSQSLVFCLGMDHIYLQPWTLHHVIRLPSRVFHLIFCFGNISFSPSVHAILCWHERLSTFSPWERATQCLLIGISGPPALSA